MAAQLWAREWSELALEVPPGVLADLIERHAEKHRHYHNLAHVLDCLQKAEGCRDLQENPTLVDLAFWFHDAIYSPRRSDNEEQSACLARESLESSLPEASVDLVVSIILDTAHQREPSTTDGVVAVDIDLSILGESPARFDAYEMAVRREYSWVPWFLYRRKRAQLLRQFLECSRIFRTESFHERYDLQARENLERSLARL